MTHLDQYYRLGMVAHKTTYGHFGLYIENMYLPDNNKRVYVFVLESWHQVLEIKSWKSRAGDEELKIKSWRSRVGDEELEMKSWRWRVGYQELNIKSWRSRVGDGELEMKSWRW